MKKEFLKFLLVFFFLFGVVLIKYQFFLHPNRQLFSLSNSDIMLKAPEFLRKPTPIPYFQSYIEYPVLVGVWNTFLAYFSQNAKDFFLLSGLFLSFFSAVNIWLARELSRLYFGRDVSVFKLLTPSVIFFTFYNWDAIAVFFLLSSLLFISANKSLLATLLASLGFWVKVFPGFVLVSVCLRYIMQKKFLRAGIILAIFIVISLLLNLRFYLLSAEGWGLFFKFSSSRSANIDSIWSGLYSISDKVFGSSFYYKKYYDTLVNYLSLGLFELLVLYYFIKKYLNKKTVDLISEVTLVLAFFLLSNKVYSPQYNLWIVLLLVVLGVSYKKIMIYEIINIFLIWAVFQYFQEVYIAGRQLLTFPLFKLIYLLSFLRHSALILITFEIWQSIFPKYEKNN